MAQQGQYDNTNRGIISKNDRKEKDTHPDYKGEINVGGVDYWLDGWIKQRKDGNGSFLSLSIKPKQQAQSTPAPQQRPAQRPASQPVGDQFANTGNSDDLPF